MEMKFRMFLITSILLLVRASTSDHYQYASDYQYASAAVTYWKRELPGVPIPKPLLNSLPKVVPKSNNDIRLKYDVNKDDYEIAAKKQLIKELNPGISLYILRDDLLQKGKVTLDLKYHLDNCKQDQAFPPKRHSRGGPPALTTSSLPKLLEFFNVSRTSIEAELINNTLNQCEHLNSIGGSHHFCATSVEEFVDSLVGTYGKSTSIKAINVQEWPPYSIKSYRLADHKLLESTFMSCHKLSFPYGVFRCHQPSSSELYSISLVGSEDKTKIKMFAVCHTDTTHWNPTHAAFILLGRHAKRGDSVCHFLQLTDMVWLQA